VSDSHTYFALREVRRLYSTKKIMAALLGIAVILGIAGPFGTSDAMRTGPLIMYWIVIAYSTFAAGTFVGAWSSVFCRSRGLGQPVSIALTSLGTGVITVLIVVLVNWASFNLAPTSLEYLGTLVASTFLTAAIIALILYNTDLFASRVAVAEPAIRSSRILERLPYDKRGDLISMSVFDHYVEVTTTKGQDLVLIRLSDAIAETEGDHGTQVHRSHWVALGQVKAATRKGDRAILTLLDGREIPVSRSFIPAIKDAGLLPK